MKIITNYNQPKTNSSIAFGQEGKGIDPSKVIKLTARDFNTYPGAMLVHLEQDGTEISNVVVNDRKKMGEVVEYLTKLITKHL